MAAIRNFPRPKTARQFKGFLGLTNFYHKFSKQYASVTAPLQELLKKGAKFKWTNEIDTSFKRVKKEFEEAVTLRHPDPNKMYFLQTDASDIAAGGQLYQIGEDQEIAVIAYTSRTFKGAERFYSTAEKELYSVVICLRKFRTYVLGKQLTVITDNKAITFMNNCRLLNARMTRWILLIQEYNITIKHCRGKENIVADTLSRFPEDNAEVRETGEERLVEILMLAKGFNLELGKTLKNFEHVQKQDNHCQNIIENLNKNNHKIKDHYLLCQGKLFRKEREIWKLMIPKDFVKILAREIHEVYGHIGINKCYRIFKEDFTGDHIDKNIRDEIIKCKRCQKCKFDIKHRNAELSPVVPKGVGELVCVDYYGPLPKSSGGCKYIFVMIDAFTKYTKLYKVRNTTTVTTLKQVRKYIQEVQVPKCILSDNGTQFTTQKWEAGLAELGIRKKTVAIRNPQGNMAERVMRQIGQFCRILLKDKHEEWGKIVEVIETCINEAYHETIETTPIEAQFKRKPTRSWTRYLIKPDDQQKPIISDAEIYLRIKEKRKRFAKKFNEQHPPTEYEIGEQVLVRACIPSKLIAKRYHKFCELYVPIRIYK